MQHANFPLGSPRQGQIEKIKKIIFSLFLCWGQVVAKSIKDSWILKVKKPCNKLGRGLIGSL